MSLQDDSSRRAISRSPLIGAGIVGFALGGFFDGILLHQVLQWHHFLSLLEGERYQDIRVQILADGLFHVAVYITSCLGLWLLWKKGQRRPADRLMLAAALLGFSIWQFSDVVLVHWIVGIHRIRVGVPNPLLWDLGWLVAFGIPSLIAGLWLLHNGDGSSGISSNAGRGRVTAVLSSAVFAAALTSMLPTAQTATVVMFRPGTGAAPAFAAAALIGARVIWSDQSGEVLALDIPEGSTALDLYRHGALLISSNRILAGCLGWTRV
jgi:uncharacterized membrane protein